MTHEEYESKSQMKRVEILKAEEKQMSHEELLAICDNYSFKDSAEPVKALRAVVELHKPINNPNFPNVDEWCWQCADGRGYAKYPCPTIQAIQKELG